MIETLDALARAFPYPAFLVDLGGQMRWASAEGLRRFDLQPEAAPEAPPRGPLAALLRCAAACLSSPAECPDRLLRAAGLVRPGERALARRYQAAGQEMVLLALTPALAEGGQPAPPAGGTHAPPDGAQGQATGAAASIPGLSRVEAEVARLAVEGFSVTNISARLGSAESTVRTHLRRVYKKLGVHGRAELAYVLLHGTTRSPKDQP